MKLDLAQARGAVGPWFITPHAVRRFVERVRRGASYEDARDELIAISGGAHFVKALPGGLELWRGPKPLRLRLRLSRGGGGLPQLVTVIEDCDGRRRGSMSHGKASKRQQGIEDQRRKEGR